MAHGDALIFLTNITWVFTLFIFLYLFFVVFFLPTFYKKFRIRSWFADLITGVQPVVIFIFILTPLTFIADWLREFGDRILKFFFSKFHYFTVRPLFTVALSVSESAFVRYSNCRSIVYSSEAGKYVLRTLTKKDENSGL